jgi:protein NirF
MRRILAALALVLPAVGARAAEPRGTGDLGIVVERAAGSVQIVETTGDTALGRVEGLGDLSHASAVFSRDGRFAFVFGRDGGLTKLDLLEGRIDRRIAQAGNSIGGAISADGSLVAVANYEPGGVKVFDAETLALVADIPSVTLEDGKRAKVVGLEDTTGRRFAWSLYEAGQTWLADLSDPGHPKVERFENIGRLPYDALVTPDGRYYVAGLFGEDGLAVLDLWTATAKARRPCRSTRCRISRAGPKPATSCSCRRSAATSSCWSTAAAGRRQGACLSTASPCSRWRAPTGVRSG